MIDVSAASSKTALARTAAPRVEKSGTCVPSGAIRTPVSPEPDEDAMLSETVRFWMSSVPPELTVTVELSVPGPAGVAAGIDWLTADGRKLCGAVIEPVGPMIASTWPGVKVLTCIGRSKVTWYVLVVSLVSSSGCRAAADDLPRGADDRGGDDLRAGDDQRQGVLIERRAEDVAAVLVPPV